MRRDANDKSKKIVLRKTELDSPCSGFAAAPGYGELSENLLVSSAQKSANRSPRLDRSGVCSVMQPSVTGVVAPPRTG